MTIGTRIAALRKERNLTQEALANALGVTNQAVSKWESDQNCPDIVLLPAIADFFGSSIDALFGRSLPVQESGHTVLPWEDDDTLRAVVFKGHTYLADRAAGNKMCFQYTGDVLNLQCAFDCEIKGNVRGDVTAAGDVTCDRVDGNISAMGDITSDDVAGNVSAGGDVTCDDVGGNVNAGGNVTCDKIGGDVTAGGNVTC